MEDRCMIFTVTFSFIFFRKSSKGAKTNGHRKCRYCMTAPGPIPAVKQHRYWHPSGSVPCHMSYLPSLAPSDIRFLTRWRISYMVADYSLIVTACKSSVCKSVHAVPKYWFASSIRKLPERQWCIDISGQCVECAEVWLCGCRHLSACISGESQLFLNDSLTFRNYCDLEKLHPFSLSSFTQYHTSISESCSGTCHISLTLCKLCTLYSMDLPFHVSETKLCW
jgi:hypothetical protein